MRAVSNIDKLGLDLKRKHALLYFLEKATKLDKIENVYLFGSCATGNWNEKSDIDLIIIGEAFDDNDDEFVQEKCCPNYFSNIYVGFDVIYNPKWFFEENKQRVGSLQYRCYQYGVDLTNILEKLRKKVAV